MIVKMAPTKKRERESMPGVVNGNGSGGGENIPASNINTTSVAQHQDLAQMNGHHQQEQELFLQAFEKPTQIYRFLRNRHSTSAIFLNRTLDYMKDRYSRTHKGRTVFKVDEMLSNTLKKKEASNNSYLNIVYSGVFQATRNLELWNDGDVICVECTVCKIIKNKRKETTSDRINLKTFTSNVIFNPHDDIDEFSAISIPLDVLGPLGDHYTTHKLLFSIKINPKISTKKDDPSKNGEPDSKRLKGNVKNFGCDITVFEKNSAIPQADYEVALHEVNFDMKGAYTKKSAWETLPDNLAPLSAKFDVFKSFPVLRFRLTWSPKEVPNCIYRCDLKLHGGCYGQNLSNTLAVTEKSKDSKCDKGNEGQINHNNNCIKEVSNTNGRQQKAEIVYNFLYSNNTRQQTEYTREVRCPWCGLNCIRLYSLMKHLKLCHARFNFAYQPMPNGVRIDVTINDSYDGSYAGSAHDLTGPSGCSFARTSGPIRRTSVTNWLVIRPRRQRACQDEIPVIDEDDLNNQRPYITGHNRLYHHAETCLPVHPKELGIDSEGESDPLWLQQKTVQMIDEFSDVNEGEKELMKLWNLHVMKYGYVGDCQLPLALDMFLTANGHDIIRKNLFKNFQLHLCSLFDYGLISPETVYTTIQKLQEILTKFPEGRDMMSKQHEKQLKYWREVGVHKKVETRIKSPQKPSNLDGGMLAINERSHINSRIAGNSPDIRGNARPLNSRRGSLRRASLQPQEVSEGTDNKAINGQSPAKKSVNEDDYDQVDSKITTKKNQNRGLTDNGDSSMAHNNGSNNNKNKHGDEPSGYVAKKTAMPNDANKRQKTISKLTEEISATNESSLKRKSSTKEENDGNQCDYGEKGEQHISNGIASFHGIIDDGDDCNSDSSLHLKSKSFIKEYDIIQPSSRHMADLQGVRNEVHEEKSSAAICNIET